MSEEDKQVNVRLDVIDKLYDKLDGIIDEAYEKDKISYGEIDIAFMKLNEKILQQKITLMYSYLKDEHETEDKKEPHGLYR